MNRAPLSVCPVTPSRDSVNHTLSISQLKLACYGVGVTTTEQPNALDRPLPAIWANEKSPQTSIPSGFRWSFVSIFGGFLAIYDAKRA